MQDVFDRYGLTYITGPLPKQVASAWAKIVRLSLPNDFFKETPVVAPVVQLLNRAVEPTRSRTVRKAAYGRELGYGRGSGLFWTRSWPRATSRPSASRVSTTQTCCDRPWWSGVAIDVRSPSLTAR